MSPESIVSVGGSKSSGAPRFDLAEAEAPCLSVSDAMPCWAVPVGPHSYDNLCETSEAVST